MNSTFDSSKPGDKQVTITIRGRPITMSKRVGAVIAWTVSVVASAIAAAIAVVVLHTAGTVVAALLVIAAVAFAIPYYRRTMREVRAREAAEASGEYAVGGDHRTVGGS